MSLFDENTGENDFTPDPSNKLISFRKTPRVFRISESFIFILYLQNKFDVDYVFKNRSRIPPNKIGGELSHSSVPSSVLFFV